ncbi:MAG: DMT family transporter [Candidatus Bathyarchaeia archaeon]
MFFTLMILIWGLNWTVMKVGLNFVGPLNLAMQRLLFASIAMLPVLFWKKKNFPRGGETWLKLFILSLINAASTTFTYIGLMHESSGLSSLMTYTQPLFVYCLAILLLNERASLAKTFGVLIGFSGVAVLYAGRISLTSYGLGWISFLILGAFLWAVTVIYYKKILNYVDPAIVNIIQFPVGFVFLFLAALLFEGLTFNWNAPLYIFTVLYMSILASAVAFTIWILLIREEETIVVSTSSLLVPAIALISGRVFLGEAIEASSIFGFILILVGIYLTNRTSRGMRRILHPIRKFQNNSNL